MNESIIVMIPARMGSQRLKKKNLRTLAGIPLVVRALRKCVMCDLFDEVWLNSENTYFADIASAEGVQFHKRPDILGGNDATSEQYISSFYWPMIVTGLCKFTVLRLCFHKLMLLICSICKSI